MIVPALSNWIFFKNEHEEHETPRRIRWATCLGRIREDIEVQPKITLLSHCHIVADHLDRWVQSSETFYTGLTYILNEGSFSGMCVSGRTVLF